MKKYNFGLNYLDKQIHLLFVNKRILNILVVILHHNGNMDFLVKIQIL